MGFTPVGETAFESRGEQRGSLYRYDQTDRPGVGGAGTVHHVAWASPMDEHEAWRERIAAAGARPTPVIDRFYFRSIYFREPSGVLFEIATIGPGFATDEPLEHLGERLSLPPAFEHLRDPGRAAPDAAAGPASVGSARLTAARRGRRQDEIRHSANGGPRGDHASVVAWSAQ